MQYLEYIANDNARREREVQLANQYNQKPEGQRVQNLWMVGMEKHKIHTITSKEVLEVMAGLLIIGGVLLLSIWL